ncbi:MAG: AAA family ATPase [Legionellales bacterium]|nr:AAA family ATPase [Legionellales bacterium]
MAEVIVGRLQERKELLEMFNSKAAEFLVLYGRRRIGKSYLIEKIFEKKSCYFFHVTGVQNGTIDEQIKEFVKAIGNTFYKGAAIATSKSWMDAFEELTKAIDNTPKNTKIILFFDELPWLCTRKSRLIQAIDYYWNRYWKNNKQIKLIICGSSASWIIRKIIHHKGGLHNRNTRTMLLNPFNLNETKDFLHSAGVKVNNEQVAQIYMFCGGIPYYLNYIKKSKSPAQLIDQMCFQENGVLYNEFEKLFDSLFDDSETYKELIRVIAQSREGVNHAKIELKSTYLSKGGTLSGRLKDLEDAAFIKSFIPLGHKRQGIYYRVIDEYCYFYLRWIESAKKTLITQERNNKYWSSKLSSAEYHNWMGYSFESICYKHIGEIRRALNINIGSTVGVWRYSPRKNSTESGAQIDLVFDRDDGIVTLCEIKFSKNKFIIDKHYAEILKKKMAVYKKITGTNKKLLIAMITNDGIKENKYSDELISDIITLNHLFAEY